jgi:hypothetical protein
LGRGVKASRAGATVLGYDRGQPAAPQGIKRLMFKTLWNYLLSAHASRTTREKGNDGD